MKVVKDKASGRKAQVTNEEAEEMVDNVMFTYSTKGALRHQRNNDKKNVWSRS